MKITSATLCLVGGAKSGKTTLAETMLFEAKVINRRGSVEQKNTVSDFHELEHERGISVYATPRCTRNGAITKSISLILRDSMISSEKSLHHLRVADTAVMSNQRAARRRSRNRIGLATCRPISQACHFSHQSTRSSKSRF
jgi:septin family protein